MMKKSCCRFCDSPLEVTFADLGMSPLSNAFVRPENVQRMEAFYPLHAYVCGKCFLVQLEEFESPANIFQDYVYFSSYSESWLKHCEAFTQTMKSRFALGEKSLVVELASNDGYLLQYFKAAGVPVLGIEPAANVAKVAQEKGIPTEVMFFGRKTATELRSRGTTADMVVGNNVLAHVPDINGFVAGMKTILKSDGVISMEFPHLLRLIEENQFDTIYHEHFSYLSFLAVEQVFAKQGLVLFDVEQLPTHGGSLRIFGRHAEDGSKPVTARVQEMKKLEADAGLGDLATYRSFAAKVKETKNNLLSFLIQAKRDGRTVAGYGAAAKGNTLLNYCGIREDYLEYVVDKSPHKQGLLLPGTHIRVEAPERLRETRPDYVVILPWNLRREIAEQIAYVREWGGKLVVPIPSLEVF